MKLPPYQSDSDVKSYYTNLQALFQKHNTVPGLTISFDPYIRNPKLVTPQMRRFLREDGHIYEETIITTMVIVSKLLSGLYAGLGLLGLVQSSKTATQILSLLIYCAARYLKEERVVHPFFFIPNQKGTYLGQFQEKYDQLFACFKMARIQYNGTEIGVQEYVDLAHGERTEALSQIRPDARDFFTTEDWKSLHSMISTVINTKPVLILPMSKKFVNVMPVIVAALKRQNHAMIFDRDEAHSAVASGSVTDDIMEAVFEAEQSIYSAVNRHNGDAKFLATSATNWGALHLELIPLCVGPNYCGIDFGFEVNGIAYKVAEFYGVKIKEPQIVSMVELSKLINCPYLPYVVPYWWSNEDNFLKHLEEDGLQGLFSGHRDYRKKCALAVAKVLNFMLIDDGFRKGHRGELVRFMCNNKLMDQFITEVALHLDPRIKIVKEYEDGHSSIKELLMQNRIGPEDFYVVFATGGARMSDSFPKDCGYGLDLTRNADTLSSLIQGVLGRIGCGYDKDPVVILSQDNKARIRNYIDNGYFPTTGEKLFSKVKARNGGSYQRYDKYKYTADPVMMGIFQRLQDVVNDEGKLMIKEGRPQFSLGSNVKKDFFDDILTPAGFQHIKDHYAEGFTLLERDDTDDKNRRYHQHENNVVMTIRAEGGDRHDHHGGRPGDKITVCKNCWREVQQHCERCNRPGVTLQGLRAIVRIKIRQVGRYKKPCPEVIAFDLVRYHYKRPPIVNVTNTVPGKIVR